MTITVEVSLNLDAFIAGILVDEHGADALNKSKGAVRKQVKREISKRGLDRRFDILDLV